MLHILIAAAMAVVVYAVAYPPLLRRLDRRHQPALDPPDVQWDELDEATAAWVKHNLELAGWHEPTGSPDVVDLGDQTVKASPDRMTLWTRHNPVLVAKIKQFGATPQDIEMLSISDWAYVRPYILRQHTDPTFVDWDPNA